MLTLFISPHHTTPNHLNFSKALKKFSFRLTESTPVKIISFSPSLDSCKSCSVQFAAWLQQAYHAQLMQYGFQSFLAYQTMSGRFQQQQQQQSPPPQQQQQQQNININLRGVGNINVPAGVGVNLNLGNNNNNTPLIR